MGPTENFAAEPFYPGFVCQVGRQKHTESLI